jgi:hypothetical protein
MGERERDAARYARSDNSRGRDIWVLTREANTRARLWHARIGVRGAQFKQM